MNIVGILERCGVGGIKLGQFASTRYDLLPAGWIEQLSRLREQNRPVHLQLDESPFLYLDPVPIATASIGQVYRGVLQTGEEVAIKVQKPGAERQIRQTIRLLKMIFALPALWHPRSRDMLWLVGEFERTLRDETNYLVEASNMDRMRATASIRIPKVFWEHTTKRQLVTEFIHGETLGTQHAEKAKELVHTLMEQMLLQGLFHADLHPGNLKVQPDGQLVMLDFGMVGRLSGRLRESLILLAYGFLIDQEQLVMESMLQLCTYSKPPNPDALLQEVRRFMDLYISTPLNRVDFRSALFELLGMLRSYGIFIKPEMVYVVKALVTTEGVAVGLDGSINIKGMMAPLQEKMLQTGIDLLAARLQIDALTALRNIDFKEVIPQKR
ncbi:ABC1 kinase family protein [Paenibacillus bovis]|uniref:ABC transporter n=1 Tax=Paenibacillus bovis TaxID=1616788 RepID=A0A1X9T495_9BACL|nr:AarF/UbiB family protein [Paenibacillus bovis]ARR10758.1 ABC transporter [Paenibacillus bovis]